MQTMPPEIDNYPQGEILREDDHQFRSTAYFAITSKSFHFEGYHRGSETEKKRHGINKQLGRYFAKRHFLFSRFDQGIQLDQESWYSVIPEPVSLYLCQRLQKAKIKNVFEPFCGAGGIAVHLAGQFNQYVANDIDPNKLKMLRHNLAVYGKKEDKITILNHDFLAIEPFATDAVIICPPWGGPDTSQYASADLDELMQPQLTTILSHASQFSSQIMLQMPKHTNLRNLLTIAHRSGLQGVFSVQKIQTNERCSQLFIYFGKNNFTGMSAIHFQTILLNDLTMPAKNDRKRIKQLLKQNSTELFKEAYKARCPNKRRLLT